MVLYKRDAALSQPLGLVGCLLLMFGAYCLTYIQMDIASESNEGEEKRMSGAKVCTSAALSVSAAVMVNFAAAVAG